MGTTQKGNNTKEPVLLGGNFWATQRGCQQCHPLPEVRSELRSSVWSWRDVFASDKPKQKLVPTFKANSFLNQLKSTASLVLHRLASSCPCSWLLPPRGCGELLKWEMQKEDTRQIRGDWLLLALHEGGFHRARQGEVCLQLLRFSSVSLPCDEVQRI